MKRIAFEDTCLCGGELHMIDAFEFSKTLACGNCHSCWLLITRPEFAVSIVLRDFHLRRGDGPGKQPIADLHMATGLVECLSRDCRPCMATIIEYGIDTDRHWAALQHAARAGVTAYDFDRVMGDGWAITRLIRSVPKQPYANVEFSTGADKLDWQMRKDDWQM